MTTILRADPVDEWGVYSFRDNAVYKVQPPTRENAERQAELLSAHEGCEAVTLAAGHERMNKVARVKHEERLRAARAAEWADPRHRNCCPRCGWHVSSHGISSYGLDCPGGASPAAKAGHLPSQIARREAEKRVERRTWSEVWE